MTAPDAPIRAAFPSDDPVSRSVRIALLRVLHAGMWAETSIGFTRDWLARMIDETPHSIWYGPETAHTLAGSLRTLAAELDKAVAALNSARPHWQQFAQPVESFHDVSIRRPDSSGERGDTPF